MEKVSVKMASGDVNNPLEDSFLERKYGIHSYKGMGGTTKCEKESVLLTPSAPRNSLCTEGIFDARDELYHGYHEMTSQVYFFLLQMKLLNTLDLIRAVCKPWGTHPHGNDYVYHFNQIANAGSLQLLQHYEMIFRVIYDRFERLGSESPASLWSRVEDVDYFKVIYHLECLRLNRPFDNVKYIELLERTLRNLDQQEHLLEQNGTDDSCEMNRYDELPMFGKYNWQSKTHSYSLTGLADEDEGTVLPSDGDFDISSAFNVSEDTSDDVDRDSELVNTCTNTLDVEDNFDEDILATLGEIQEPKAPSEADDFDNFNEDFNKIVMEVLNRQTIYNNDWGRRNRNTNSENILDVANPSRIINKTSRTHNTRRGPPYGSHGRPEAASRSEEHKRKRRRRKVEPCAPEISKLPNLLSVPDVEEEFANANPGKNNTNVVSASVSYDKRQQRFMAQWKTREGTKHSKSFYAKRYVSPLLARKHAELYKMYILQHRGKGPQEIAEPTYEQLAAQNFQPLENINISDCTFMDEFE